MAHDKSLERAILIQDLAVVLFAVWVSHPLREAIAGLFHGLKPAVPTRDYIHLLLAFVPVWVWCADHLGVQRLRRLTGPLVELLASLLWAQTWAAIGIAAILVLSQTLLNRSLVAVFLVVSTLLLVVTKLLQRSWVRRSRGQALALVLEGDQPNRRRGESGGDTAGEFERLRGRRVERITSLDPGAVRTRLQRGEVDEVAIPAGLEHEQLRAILEACEEVGVPAMVRVERIDLGLARPRAEVVGPTLYLSYETHEPDRPSLLLKGVLDRVLAAIALALLFPLLLIIGILIRLTSSGPAFFVQIRGGQHARPFPMLKFRTMRVGAEAERERLMAANEMNGPVFKMSNDPRVTPLGRFLRRTSMDELPQLANIVLGHMSLVGPRPLPLVEMRELSGAHRRRLSFKPGLTCLWQISGRNELGFDEWMALDLQYVDNWSLGLDLAILLRTLPALLTGRGAR